MICNSQNFDKFPHPLLHPKDIQVKNKNSDPSFVFKSGKKLSDSNLWRP